MSESFDLDDPELFTAGAVGPPGERVFYLQARQGAEVCSLKLEKQQVAALAEYLEGLVSDLPDDDPPASTEAFREPGAAHWTVGTIGVGYDNEADRIVIVVEELVPDLEDDESGGEAAALAGTARIRVTRGQAQAFIAVSEELMSGGRPPCPLCARPLDPQGHACPRLN